MSTILYIVFDTKPDTTPTTFAQMKRKLKFLSSSYAAATRFFHSIIFPRANFDFGLFALLSQ